MRQHVEVGVEGMRETERERVRHEGRHTALSGGQRTRGQEGGDRGVD